MPPRIPVFKCLRASKPTNSSTATTSRPFTSTSAPQASTATPTATQRRRRHDPYAIAQAKARKAANLSRQEVLKKERAAALGDPVRGLDTPFLRSLNNDSPPDPATSRSDSEVPGSSAQDVKPLNFALDTTELAQGLEHSKWLSSPPPSQLEEEDATAEITPEERQSLQEEEHATATEALKRISSLSLGSSKANLHVNIRRIVSTFGRHTTDSTLPPAVSDPDRTPVGLRPASASAIADSAQHQRPPRVGPDTGSSEVQIAILTAKIRTLADFLAGRGSTDKVNKRNLRLLVHRRQRLLRYLERRDRGGPRFQNVVNALGLTEGTWKGEISL